MKAMSAPRLIHFTLVGVISLFFTAVMYRAQLHETDRLRAELERVRKYSKEIADRLEVYERTYPEPPSIREERH